MSLASTVSLGALRLQAQDRADLINSSQISVPAWNQYLSQSHKRLFNKLVGAYGNDYHIAPLFQFAVGNSQLYPLPNGLIASLGQTAFAPALFKILLVMLQYSGAPTGWITLRRFEDIETNRFAFPNQAVNYNGITNLMYRLSGENLEFIPVPQAGQVVQIKYIQKPKSLQWLPTCATALGSAVVLISDASDITVGMSVMGPGVQKVPVATTVTGVNTAVTPNQVTLSLPVFQTNAYATLAFWSDATTIDGVSGWEEFIIIDAAIKAKIKQEQPIEDLITQRNEIVMEIEAMAEGRDAGQAHHVSDVMAVNAWGGGFDGGMGGGGGFGGGF